MSYIIECDHCQTGFQRPGATRKFDIFSDWFTTTNREKDNPLAPMFKEQKHLCSQCVSKAKKLLSEFLNETKEPSTSDGSKPAL